MSVKKEGISSKKINIVNWLKIISITGATQGIVQILGLLSGIIIIRVLPTKEYALYTIAYTTLGTMSLLSDSGISTAVMALGSKVWQDREKLGAVLVTGMQIRKKFAVLSLTISIPILIYLLINHGAGILFSILIVLAIIPSFIAALSDSLLEIVPKLHQDILLLQKNQIAAGLGRFALISLSILIFPYTFIAIIGNGLPRLWANIRLRKISSRYADYTQPSDPAIKKEINLIVTRSMPEVIYYCLSGQITIWLIAFLGSTTSIAQIGALGRLSTVLTLFGTLFSTLIVPRFARLGDNYKILLNRFFQIEIGVFALCAAIVSLVYFFPAEILWILGKKYSSLNGYLTLNFIGSCLSLVTGITFSLYACKGWIINPLLSIPFNIGMIIGGILLFDLSTIRGIFMFNIFLGTTQTAMHSTYAVIKILQLRKKELTIFD